MIGALYEHQVARGDQNIECAPIQVIRNVSDTAMIHGGAQHVAHVTVQAVRGCLTDVQKTLSGAKVAVLVTDPIANSRLKSLELSDIHSNMPSDFKNPEVIEVPPLATHQLSGPEYGQWIEPTHLLFPHHLFCIEPVRGERKLQSMRGVRLPVMDRAKDCEVGRRMIATFRPWLDVVNDDGARRISTDTANPAIVVKGLDEDIQWYRRPAFPEDLEHDGFTEPQLQEFLRALQLELRNCPLLLPQAPGQRTVYPSCHEGPFNWISSHELDSVLRSVED